MCETPQTHEETARMSQGMRVVYEAIVEALVNEPSDRIIDDMKNVAGLLGDDRFADVTPGDVLAQRYYDRFFVASSAFHIAWEERAVWTANIANGRVEYGSPAVARSAHVLSCYREAGFDFRALSGYEIAVKSLKPDSLASELAFMAFLHDGASRAFKAGDIANAAANRRLALSFLTQHLSKWTPRTAELAALSGNDFYARLAAFAVDAVEMDKRNLAETLC